MYKAGNIGQTHQSYSDTRIDLPTLRRGELPPHQRDTLELRPLAPSNEESYSAAEICSAIATVAFFPIWAVIALCLWCCKPAVDKAPLEVTEAINLIKSTQTPSDHQLDTHTFALLSAYHSLKAPLRRESPPSFLSVLFPWVHSWRPQVDTPIYTQEEQKKMMQAVYDALPENTKEKLATPRIIEHLFEATKQRNSAQQFLKSCDASTLPPFMGAVLLLYTVKSTANPILQSSALIDAYRTLKALTSFTKTAHGDVSHAYVTTVLQRFWIDASPEDRAEYDAPNEIAET